MPAYRFTWDHFSDETVLALADACGFDPDSGVSARAFLSKNFKRPNENFVQVTKDALARYWIPGYAGAKQIVDRLVDGGIGPMSNPRTASGYASYIEKTRNCRSLRGALLDALLRFGDGDRDDDAALDDSFVPRFATLELSQQVSDPRQAHDYQKEAWEKLSAHLAESDSTGVFQGLLVMPTGAGKTFAAVRWLAQRVLSRGMRVLWLAHRHELLQHAASEIHRCAALAGVPKLRVRVVSGAHCATSQIDPADHVVVASVASLARRQDIREQLLADPKLFVVIDEAHHAPAKTYRDIIRQLERQKKFRVLGLTATPTRTAEDERSELSRLFGNRVLYQVDLRRLIERGTLSRPVLVTVATHADVEAELDDDARAHLARFDEISEQALDRIAGLAARNNVIVGHLKENRARYGKTLVFAVNVRHAAMLAEALRGEGFAADYVASHRPDGTEGDPMALIRAFREGRLDVLVNVQMMTEGVDVPDVQTVFITRPTHSEILFRQMVGRGLRGPVAGGTKEAFLVSFEDHWRQYTDWEHPFDLVPELAELEERTTMPTEKEKLSESVQAVLPWDLIRATAARMREITIDQKADAFDAIPHGSYVLEREEAGEEPYRRIVAVYEHQHDCWEALIDDLYRRTTRGDIGAQAQYDEFFSDCDDPTASFADCEAVIQHWRCGSERPVFVAIAGRESCDPHAVAADIVKQGLDEDGRKKLVELRYGPLARAIYPSRREFWSAVEDALYEARYPDESTRQVRAVPIFAPRPDQQLTPGKHHVLETLLRETLVQGSEILGIDVVPALEDIEIGWTRRLVKWRYATAYYANDTPHGTGRIVVNRLLDSVDVTAETMRYLLWHEYLHLHLKVLHPPSFRELERKWPTFIASDRELDNLNERFGIQYW